MQDRKTVRKNRDEAMAEPVAAVAAVFDSHTPAERSALLRLRELIYEAAAETGKIDALAESLKWGEPSYTPAAKKIGSSVRLGMQSEDKAALYFICHTHIVDRFRDIYPDQLEYEGNRAILLPIAEKWPEAELKHCIAMALTWHLAKR